MRYAGGGGGGGEEEEEEVVIMIVDVWIDGRGEIRKMYG
jgi:hypothetical protein